MTKAKTASGMLAPWMLLQGMWLAGCASAPHALSPDEARQQVTATELAFARTMADRDLAAFGHFLAEDAVFVSGGQSLRGRKAIVAAWAPYFTAAVAPFSWAPDRVEISGNGTLGSSSGPIRSSAGKLTGRFNSVWQRQPGGEWRIVFDSGSED